MSIRLACKLTTPELQQRRRTVIAGLLPLLQSRKEINDGLAYTFCFEDKTLDKLIDFIKSERLCCEFFSFRLDIARETATLEITGPEGTKEFLEHELGF